MVHPPKTVFIVLTGNGDQEVNSWLKPDCGHGCRRCVRPRGSAVCSEGRHSPFIMRIVLSHRLAVDVVHTSEAAPARSRVGQGPRGWLRASYVMLAPAQERARRQRRAFEWPKTRTEDPLFLRVCMQKVSMTSNFLHCHHRGPLELTSAVLHEAPHADAADRGQSSPHSNTHDLVSAFAESTASTAISTTMPPRRKVH